jgi:hypothetical protein
MTVLSRIITGTQSDYQEFTAAGTWYKPLYPVGSMVLIMIWGGGGGGARNGTARGAGGGGGGACCYNMVPLSQLSSTVSVTVGAAGVGRTGSNGDGTTGGLTTFGSYASAYGGGGGKSLVITGGIGSTSNIGGGAVCGSDAAGDIGSLSLNLGGEIKSYGMVATPSFNGGYGGGSYQICFSVTDATAYGANYGGGGGGSRDTHTAGAVSSLGGNGGTGGASPTAGATPSGGGGAGAGVNAGNGGGGKVQVWVLKGV